MGVLHGGCLESDGSIVSAIFIGIGCYIILLAKHRCLLFYTYPHPDSSSVHPYLCISMCVYIYTHINTSMCIHIQSVHQFSDTYAYAYTYTYTFAYSYVYIYIHLSHIHAYIYIYTYICMDIHVIWADQHPHPPPNIDACSIVALQKRYSMPKSR